MPIERFDIVPDGLAAPAQAGQPENGWWWNASESGRGFFIEWQNGSADLAGYMYDDAGNPVWYLSVYETPDPAFSGSWWSYANGQTMGGAYKPPTQTTTTSRPSPSSSRTRQRDHDPARREADPAHEAEVLRATAEFRFYEELNDFLAPAMRKRAFPYAFHGTPSVKDAIEAIGVPHTEVDLVLVDGESVDFTRRLTGGERVAVYPVFESLRYHAGHATAPPASAADPVRARRPPGKARPLLAHAGIRHAVCRRQRYFFANLRM